MKKRATIYFQLFIVLFFFSCNNSDEDKKDTIQLNNIDKNQKMKSKVTGIGGVFFKCQNPESIKTWFHKNLDLVVNEYGSIYEFRLADNPEEFGYLQWSPFIETTDYFNPSEKELMINYRVNDLQGLLVDL